MPERTARELFLGQGPGAGAGSQNLYVNMGPAHPAMHGIIRIFAELDGEMVVKADMEIGYLHRAFEKDCESGPYNNAIPYTPSGGFPSLRGLLAVAENYPQLQASQQFTSLQASLNEVEDSLQNSRRYYNAVVRDLNTRIQSFPTNIIANMMGFTPRQFFEIAAADRENVQVKF